MAAFCINTSLEHDDSTATSSSSDHGPSLFHEIDEAINLCTLTYTLTMLRRLVREGKIQRRREEIMRLPLSLDEANELVLEEKHHLTLSKYSENKRVFTNIVKTLSDRQYLQMFPPANSPRSPLALPDRSRSLSDSRSGSRSSSSRSEALPPATVHVSTTFITGFGGEATRNGLVYSISVDIDRKVVMLCFRGAETDVDWAPLNTDVHMKDIANPMKRHASQPEKVMVHNQLYDLLIRPTLRTSNTDWETLSEYQEILEEFVIPTLLEHPGYKVSYRACILFLGTFAFLFSSPLSSVQLTVCGHSLGASLATFFSFLVAAEPDSMIPKPVTCISIGSSYVGDGSFRSAHQLLEGMRKLRHVRITNDKDLVTLSPKISFRWKFFDNDGHGGRPFKHVGMNLRLYSKGTPFEVSYPTVRGNFLTNGIDELSRAWDNSLMTNMVCNPGDYITWPLHQIREYNKRVMRSRETLEATTLDGLYHDPVIVGALYSYFK